MECIKANMPSKYHHDSSNRAILMPLIAIFSLAFIVRLICLVFFTTAANGEGAEAARIAENLVSGNGYVGIALEGRELTFPPLYPLLIAGMSFLTDDVYLAAQLVSLVAGIGLLLPLFGLARDLYGNKVAYMAIGIGALHPILIQLSATTWVEGLYLTLVTASIYWINRCRHDHRLQVWSASGAFLGLAYLTCPQALIFPVIFLFSLFLLNRSEMTHRKVAVFAASFIVLALPYVIFLSVSTGNLRFEGKTIVNNELGRLLLSDVPYNVAGYEVTETLEPKGVWMRPNAEVARSSTSFIYDTTLRVVLSKGIGNLKNVLLEISSAPLYGGPLILPLVALGLLRSTWTRRRASGELILLLVVAGSLLAMTTIIHHWDSRYHYILIPFVIIWASHGMHELTRWTFGTIVRLRAPISPVFCGQTVGGLAFLALVSLFAVGAFRVSGFEDFGPTASAVRSAGEWLATLPGDKTIMDTGVRTAFHADAKYIPMPLSNSQTALRYAEKKGVNFIVVHRSDGDARPYLRDWLNSGVPSPNATLVRTFGSEPMNQILIFRLDKPHASELQTSPSASTTVRTN